ncbi:hypothetical protein MBLNU13_g07000t3 [Cladosporium sp. NU13]
MAASPTVLPPYWSEPYLDEPAEQTIAAFQSISSHTLVQNFSFEELRLAHYDNHREKLKPCLGDTSKLMTTQQRSALRITPPSRSIKAAADSTDKFSGEAIVFLVGTDAPKRFIVHEGLIKPRSEFVRLALRGEWKEAQERTIPLPEDDPNIFSVYQRWLYDGLIHTRPNSTPSKTDDEYSMLVNAYILGEKIMDSNFKDSVADAIVEKLRLTHRFDTSLTNLIFDNTLPASPLRRLWLDAYYNFGRPEWLNASLVGDAINSEFMIEFSRYQMQFRACSGAFGPDAMFASCTYHGHGLRPCHR